MPIDYHYECDFCGARADAPNFPPKGWLDLSLSIGEGDGKYADLDLVYCCTARPCQIKAFQKVAGLLKIDAAGAE